MTQESQKIAEKPIELDFIEKLQGLKYEYRPEIKKLSELQDNFREKFEELNKDELNGASLTDNEFKNLLDKIITDDVFKASKTLRERHSFEREDGTILHYSLVNLENWCENTYEVVNQLRINTEDSYQKYDVILLINGLPVVQIELKNHTISAKKAMKQIMEYKDEAGNGYENTILCFMQLFIVSNKDDTWYFANNNKEHFKFNEEEKFLPAYQHATRDNEKITELHDFADSFLTKCTLGETISRYMVLVETEERLIMMRPYQIYAVQSIMGKIESGVGNGYIWHTTGSGKTLTSFKASTLLKENRSVDKCLFVVDRKDLDRQTREEFNRFQKDCVEENTNTKNLVKRLLSKNYKDKVIVTTIQKLGIALGKNSDIRRDYSKELQELKDKRIVFIFDECHRSQFGENHQAIKKFFPQSQLFGFTGTPIFEENASKMQANEGQGYYITTEEVFGKCLHSYTIAHAIEDRNVLEFLLTSLEPSEQGTRGTKKAVVKSILESHDKTTMNRKFNAFLATNRIKDAIEYYNLLKETQEEFIEKNPNFKKLNVTAIFSPPPDGNADIKQIQEDLPNEKNDTSINEDQRREELKTIISDYNKTYNTNFSIADFDGYYQDVQKRIKDHKMPRDQLDLSERTDITIVVDMLLTGFDSQYLNTMYIDKKLEYHRLIQAFSRTNRILNATKPSGNIIDYRKQRDKVDEAIVLFSAGLDRDKAREIWLVEKPKETFERYKEQVKDLTEFMNHQKLETKPSEVSKIKGDAARVDFILKFKEIQQTKIKLDQHVDLDEEIEKEIEELLPEGDFLGFKRAYLETAKLLENEQDFSEEETQKELPETDFVIFSQDYINYDYIMGLLEKYSSGLKGKQKMTKEQLKQLIGSEPKFINEKETLEKYIDTLKEGEGLTKAQIEDGYQEFKEAKKKNETDKIANKYKITNEKLEAFIKEITKRRKLTAENFDELFENLSLKWDERVDIEKEIVKDMKPLLNQYHKGIRINNLSAYE